MKKVLKSMVSLMLVMLLAFGSIGTGFSNDLFSMKASAAPSGVFLWPVPSSYSLSQVYGTSHKAIDIQKCANQNIVASYDGVVYKLDSGTNSSSSTDSTYGTSMIIKHNINGSIYYTHYAHMVKDSIPQKFRTIGASVKQGEIIGKVGDTGKVTGYHLHFSIASGSDIWNGRFNNTPTDSRHNATYSGGVSYKYEIEHQHDFSVYLYYWAVHPHYNDYKCSYCDVKQENRNETNYVETCEKCNHTHSYTSTGFAPANCTDNGYYTYYCDCGYNYSELYEYALGHDYSVFSHYESAHPHYAVYQCKRCSSTQRGSTSYEPSCSQCTSSQKSTVTVVPGTSATETHFSWTTTVDDAYNYELLVYTKSDDKCVVNKMVSVKNGNSYSVILPAGDYYAHVLNDGSFKYGDKVYFTVKEQPYTLTYNANGGSGVPSSQTGSVSYTVTSTKPTRNGYTFLGWSKTSNASYASYTAGDTITLTSDTTLYAVWQENVTYYSCRYCGHSFTSESECNSHQLECNSKPTIAVPDVEYSYCPRCGEAFDNEIECDEHTVTCGQQTCTNCGEIFADEAEYNAHLSNCNVDNGDDGSSSSMGIFGLILSFFASIFSIIVMIITFPITLFF